MICCSECSDSLERSRSGKIGQLDREYLLADLAESLTREHCASYKIRAQDQWSSILRALQSDQDGEYDLSNALAATLCFRSTLCMIFKQSILPEWTTSSVATCRGGRQLRM